MKITTINSPKELGHAECCSIYAVIVHRHCDYSNEVIRVVTQ